MVYIFVVGLLVGHAVCGIAGKELWPFSHYPMFSRAHPERWSELEFFAVTHGAQEEEVHVSFRAFPRPISAKDGLDRMLDGWKNGKYAREELQRAVRHLVTMARDRSSKDADHPMVNCEAVRLYRVTREVVYVGERRAGAAVVSRKRLIEVTLPSESSRLSGTGKRSNKGEEVE